MTWIVSSLTMNVEMLRSGGSGGRGRAGDLRGRAPGAGSEWMDVVLILRAVWPHRVSETRLDSGCRGGSHHVWRPPSRPKNAMSRRRRPDPGVSGRIHSYRQVRWERGSLLNGAE